MDSTSSYLESAVGHFVSDNAQGNIEIMGNYIGIVRGGTGGGSTGGSGETGVTLIISFTYETAGSYTIPSTQTIYVYPHWEDWPTFIATRSASSSSVYFTSSTLGDAGTYEYSVYSVTTGVTLTEANCEGYLVGNGSFTYDGFSETVSSTITLEDPYVAEHNYVLTFSIYYENELQEVPEYASLFFVGELSSWQFVEISNNGDNTYTYYYDGDISAGTTYTYGLLMDHTGEEGDLKDWTYRAYDGTDSRNQTVTDSDGNVNLAFTAKEECVGTDVAHEIDVYVDRPLNQIIHSHDSDLTNFNLVFDVVGLGNDGIYYPCDTNSGYNVFLSGTFGDDHSWDWIRLTYAKVSDSSAGNGYHSYYYVTLDTIELGDHSYKLTVNKSDTDGNWSNEFWPSGSSEATLDTGGNAILTISDEDAVLGYHVERAITSLWFNGWY